MVFPGFKSRNLPGKNNEKLARHEKPPHAHQASHEEAPHELAPPEQVVVKVELERQLMWKPLPPPVGACDVMLSRAHAVPLSDRVHNHGPPDLTSSTCASL